jgi:hypothetical protein
VSRLDEPDVRAARLSLVERRAQIHDLAREKAASLSQDPPGPRVEQPLRPELRLIQGGADSSRPRESHERGGDGHTAGRV